MALATGVVYIGGGGGGGPIASNIGGNVNTIGGTTCHLCGAEVEYENVYHRRKKHGVMTTRRQIGYTCGTYVSVSRKGKKRVVLGADCVDIGGRA